EPQREEWKMKPVGATLSRSFSSCSRTSNSVNNSPRSGFSAFARPTVCWKNGSDRLTSDISIHCNPGRPSTTTASTGSQPLEISNILRTSLRPSAYLCALCVSNPFNAENAEIRRGPQRGSQSNQPALRHGILPKLCRQNRHGEPV